MKKIKLFCFPYAGGSAQIYSKWRSYLTANIELVPVDFAGHGRRINQPYYNNMSDAISDVFKIVYNKIENCDYSFFGHSMGSVIALEMYYKLKENNCKEPLHIFVSGRHAPQIYNQNEIISHLSDEEFKDRILKMGGTPKEVFENEELLNYFIPCLRADFKLVEQYKYISGRRKLNCKITAFCGNQDVGATYSDMFGWGEQTLLNFVIHEFKGGHFFIFDNIKEITNIINKDLMDYV